MLTTLASVAEAQTLPENHCIVDCRFSLFEPDLGAQQYAEGHIPGAIYAHLDDDLSGEIIFRRSGRHPLPDRNKFAQTLRRWGIGNATQVVAYDDAGGPFAARLWWLLRWMGHESVAVLDGGLSSWVDAGLALSAESPQRSPGRFTARDELNSAVTTEQVASHPHWLLIDAREGARFRGDAEPIDPVAGHIPGAHNVPCQRHLDDKRRFQSADALAALYQPYLANNTIDDIVCYCGSGVTAAHSALAMTHAGLGTPKLYAGSWSEWITDPERPIGRGNDYSD